MRGCERRGKRWYDEMAFQSLGRDPDFVVEFISSRTREGSNVLIDIPLVTIDLDIQRRSPCPSDMRNFFGIQQMVTTKPKTRVEHKR